MTISNNHGVAIEFVPSEKQKFQCQVTTKRIEQEIFPDKDFNVSYIGKIEPEMPDRTGISYIGKATSFIWPNKPGPILAPKGYCYICGIAMITNRKWFLETSEMSYLRMNDMRVDDINYPNVIIIRGTNHRADWSGKVAIKNALYDLNMDFRHVCLNSENFRKFEATPELTQIANKIITRNNAGKYGEEYGPLEYERDIAELIATADAHGINRDYAMKIYTLLKEKPSWRERHWIIGGMAVGVLTSCFILFLRLGDKKISLSQRFLGWCRKN